MVKASVRYVAVVVAICSWIAISNHCVLAVLVSQEKTVPSECPFHSHPSKPPKQKDANDQPCCKILRAVTTTSAKYFTRAIADLVHVDPYFVKRIVLASPKISFASAIFNTGPPGARSFAELILQRSIRAHAPPSLA